jgi:hypothetical protein
MCGTVCDAGVECVWDRCLPATDCSVANETACRTSTGTPGVCCAGVCADIEHDKNNCGECRSRCAVGATDCLGGYCLEDAGYRPCDPYAADCPAGTACAGYQCFPLDCAAGADDEYCASGLHTLVFLSNGYDTIGFGQCCGSRCVDRQQDPHDCGACGNTCSSGLCARSVEGDLLPTVSGVCWPLDAGAGCPAGCAAGETCQDGVCAGACPDSKFCSVSDGGVGLCCHSGTCRDPLNDVSNCGGCWIFCPTGQTCQNGVCSGAQAPCVGGTQSAFCKLDAGTGFVCCPGEGCVDLGTDSANCGSCGRACMSGHTCSDGRCSP